jgi:hypothetical protein
MEVRVGWKLIGEEITETGFPFFLTKGDSEL